MNIIYVLPFSAFLRGIGCFDELKIYCFVIQQLSVDNDYEHQFMIIMMLSLAFLTQLQPF